MKIMAYVKNNNGFEVGEGQPLREKFIVMRNILKKEQK